MLERIKRKYWRRRADKLWRDRSLKAVPTGIGICVTDKCNLGCRYCMRSTFKPPKGEFTVEKVKLLLDRMPYVNSVCIMGLAEPLLNPHIADIVRYIKDERGMKVFMTTNGMVPIDDDIMDCLTRVDDFVISIDTFDDETQKFLRPGTSLPVMMGQLMQVLKFKRERGLGVEDNPPIHINAVITRQNFHQTPGLIRMLEPFADELTYLMVDPVTRPDYQDFEEPLMVDRKVFEEYIDKYKKIAKESPLKVVGFDWMFQPSYHWGNCSGSWSAPFVQPNGDMYFCYDYSNVLGNVFEEDPLKVWNSEKAQEFRRRLLSDDPPLKQCRSCNFARDGWQEGGDYIEQGKVKEDVE